MAVEQAVPGEIELKTVTVTGQNGAINCLEHLVSGSIYESIYDKGIVAEFVIRDTLALSTMLPLSGEEKLKIQFRTPSLQIREYTFQVNSMQGVAPNNNLKTRAYALKCVSEEVKHHKSNMVQKSYNTNISSIVQDIVQQYLGGKKLNVQQTKGVQKIIIPSLKPFQAIDLVRKRAVSASDKSSVFLFFENKEGYNFKTLENLMQSGQLLRKYENKATINTNIRPSTMTNIIAWNIPQQHASMDRIGQGGFNTDVRRFDFKTMKYKHTPTKPALESFKGADGILKDIISGMFKQSAGKNPAKQAFSPEDSNYPKTHIPETSADQAGYIAAASGGSIMLHVNGDSELTVGQKITTDIYETDASSGNSQLNPHISGNYLIAKLRHIIGPPGERPRYTCTIEGLKVGSKEG